MPYSMTHDQEKLFAEALDTAKRVILKDVLQNPLSYLGKRLVEVGFSEKGSTVFQEALKTEHIVIPLENFIDDKDNKKRRLFLNKMTPLISQADTVSKDDLINGLNTWKHVDELYYGLNRDLLSVRELSVLELEETDQILKNCINLCNIHSRYRTKALNILSPAIAEKIMQDELLNFWNQAFSIFVTHSRASFLQDVQSSLPIIAALRGQEGVVATFQAIEQTGTWWS
jgi:hypothetical protein